MSRPRVEMLLTHQRRAVPALLNACLPACHSQMAPPRTNVLALATMVALAACFAPGAFAQPTEGPISECRPFSDPRVSLGASREVIWGCWASERTWAAHAVAA